MKPGIRIMTRVMVSDMGSRENTDMQAVAQLPSKPQAPVRLRPIALPSEHGGWGMLGAPILTGMLVTPSWAGALIGMAGASAFLARQPFRLALTDLRKGKRYPRTGWAIRFAIGYIAVGVLALLGAVALAGGSFWLPLVLAATLGGLQFAFDIEGKGRSFVPEVSGAVAMSLLATSIALAGRFDSSKAWLLAVTLAFQSATAISYAATRVRLARGVEIAKWPVWAGHVAALAIVAGIVANGWLGWPILAAFGVLSGRAVWGVSCHRRDVRAAMVGLQEVGYAVLTVACLLASVQ